MGTHEKGSPNATRFPLANEHFPCYPMANLPRFVHEQRLSAKMDRTVSDNGFREIGIKSGVAARVSVLVVLIAMSLNIGGVDHFGSIVKNFGFFFLAVASAAFILGLFMVRYRLRWSLLSGGAIGLISGLGIVLSALSKI